MRDRKRTKHVEELIDKVNAQLRAMRVKDEDNDLFMFMVDYLLQKRMYKGFNFFMEKWSPSLGKPIPVLAGTADKSMYDYLQLY